MVADILFFNFLYGIAFRDQLLDAAIFLSAEIMAYIFSLALLGQFFLSARSRARFAYLARIGAIALSGAIFSRFVVAEAIRFFIDRTRPFAELGITPLFGHDPSHAFPSGHAAFFFGLVPAIFALSPKAGWASVIVFSVMGISRVVAGVHWPSDIVAGALIGLLSGYLLLTFAKRFFTIK